MSLQRIPMATVALGLVALVLAFLIGRDVFFPPTVNTANSLRTATVSMGSVRSLVTGTGSLVPMSAMNLGFKASGQVTEVDVKIGDKVAAGQVLAKIDPTNAQNALDQATSTLAQAQSNLANTVNGTALTQAEHALAQAQQSYSDTATSVATTNQTDQNQLSSDQQQYNVDNAQLAGDQASYWYTQYQPSLSTYQGNLNNDQARYVSDGCSSTTNYQLTAGRCHDDIYGGGTNPNPGINADVQNINCIQQGGPACTTQQQQISSAYKAVTADQGKLSADNTKIAADQTKLTLDQQSGQRSLNMAQNAITNAQDSINSQTANRGATIAAQQAAVQVAQDSVNTAQTNLNGTTLTAPFAGIVTALNGAVGDTAAATNNATVPTSSGSSGTGSSGSSGSSNSSSGSSSSSGFVTLSDVSAFQVVAPLAEADASRVQSGQAASVTFDAVQSLTLPAHVTLVAPTATVTSNVVNYSITFALDQSDPRLKSGMTTNVTDTVASASNVITVPNSAITRIGTRAFVTILDSAGKQVRTLVQTGVAGDTSTEITSGLNVGEKVVLPQLRTTTGAGAQRGGGGLGGGGGIRVGGGG